MTYEVRWSSEAEQQLFAILSAATDPSPLVAAAWALNNALATDAHEVGESRDPGERIAFAPGLGMRFEFSYRLQFARIIFVWPVKE